MHWQGQRKNRDLKTCSNARPADGCPHDRELLQDQDPVPPPGSFWGYLIWDARTSQCNNTFLIFYFSNGPSRRGNRLTERIGSFCSGDSFPTAPSHISRASWCQREDIFIRMNCSWMFPATAQVSLQQSQDLLSNTSLCFQIHSNENKAPLWSSTSFSEWAGHRNRHSVLSCGRAEKNLVQFKHFLECLEVCLALSLG